MSLNLQDQFQKMADDKRAEMVSREGQISEVKEQLSRLTGENKADEQMIVEFEKLAAQYGKAAAK